MVGLRYTLGLKLRHAVIQRVEKQGAAAGGHGGLILRLFKSLAGLPNIGPDCHALAGAMHTGAGHHRAAIPHYEAALAGSRSRDAGLHHRLGLARLRAKDPAGAEPSFRRALELAPDAHWSYGGLGECLLALNRPADAEPILRKGLEANPGNRWLRYQLAVSQIRQGRAGAALDELLEAAAAAEPGPEPFPVPLPWYLFSPAMATPPRAEALGAIVERHPRAEEAMIFLAQTECALGRYGESTARLRQAAGLRWRADTTGPSRADPKPPSFLIIGQAKAGTTALYGYLCSHPLVEPPLIKEPHFWSLKHAAGPDWYRAHFPPLPPDSGRISGEASATYFQHGEAPGRIARNLPGVKLILLLRNPLERAYSHYWMGVRLGGESRNWADVVATDLAAWPRCPLEPGELASGPPLSIYLQHSAVLPHLKRWLSHFPKEQLLILRATELTRDMPGTLRRVCAFLDLPPFAPERARRENEGHYPPMAPDIEQRLRAWFAPHERALEDFLTHLDEEP